MKSIEDDLNRGEDKRLWPWFTDWWQTISQVSFLKHFDTIFSFTFEVFPPGGFYSFSIPWGEPDFAFWRPKEREGKKFKVAVHPVVNIRAGWLWMPALAVAHWQGWPWWAWTIGFLLGIFLNWRRDRNSGESYWTLSINVDQEAKSW